LCGGSGRGKKKFVLTEGLIKKKSGGEKTRLFFSKKKVRQPGPQKGRKMKVREKKKEKGGETNSKTQGRERNSRVA